MAISDYVIPQIISVSVVVKTDVDDDLENVGVWGLVFHPV